MAATTNEPPASVPLSYYRGGTSKAVFFHESDIPPPGLARDKFLKRLMGSPDPMQIDGMGGSHVVTSKIAIVRPSTRYPETDVDYTFAQISIKNDAITYSANCGNISSAVGPFAITEGLVKHFRAGEDVSALDKTIHRTQEVRIYVTGTKKVLTEHVPVDENDRVIEIGAFSIDGCPGTGAPILIDFKDTIGGACGRGVLPTGHTVDHATVAGQKVPYTICDVGSTIVFARASDFGIGGGEEPAVLDENQTLLAKIRELRGKASQVVGLCHHWEKVDEESPLPMVALISPATVEAGHIQSRLFLDNKTHTSMAGSGSVCHAACSRVSGTIVNRMLRAGTEAQAVLNIQHPQGLMSVAVTIRKDAGAVEGRRGPPVPEFETLSFVRTARRILKGDIDIPDNVKQCFLTSIPRFLQPLDSPLAQLHNRLGQD